MLSVAHTNRLPVAAIRLRLPRRIHPPSPLVQPPILPSSREVAVNIPTTLPEGSLARSTAHYQSALSSSQYNGIVTDPVAIGRGHNGLHSHKSGYDGWAVKFTIALTGTGTGAESPFHQQQSSLVSHFIPPTQRIRPRRPSFRAKRVVKSDSLLRRAIRNSYLKGLFSDTGRHVSLARPLRRNSRFLQSPSHLCTAAPSSTDDRFLRPVRLAAFGPIPPSRPRLTHTHESTGPTNPTAAARLLAITDTVTEQKEPRWSVYEIVQETVTRVIATASKVAERVGRASW